MAIQKLTKVRVISATGATLRGEMIVKLSEAQHAPRAHVLGPWRKGGVFEMAGDQAISFKLGEEFAVHQPGGRLNKAIFAWDEPAAKPGKAAEPAPAGDEAGDEDVAADDEGGGE